METTFIKHLLKVKEMLLRHAVPWSALQGTGRARLEELVADGGLVDRLDGAAGTVPHAQDGHLHSRNLHRASCAISAASASQLPQCCVMAT